MTGMLRVVLRLGCAAAVVFTAAETVAMQAAPGTAPRASPAPAAPSSGPAGAPPAPAPAPASDPASLPPPPAPSAGDPASLPLHSAPPTGDGGAPPAGVSPPGPPPPPPEWSRSPDPYPWQPGSAPALEQPKPKRVWYGWQHLLVLGGTLVLAPIAVATENEPLAWLSAGAFVLGGPITHWANGHLGKGFASLGLNAGCTLGGGMVGLLIGSSSDSRDGWDALAGMLIGSSLGLVTANIIDIAVLQHEEPTTTESYDYIRLRSPRLRLAPHVALAPDRATFGLGGAF